MEKTARAPTALQTTSISPTSLGNGPRGTRTTRAAEASSQYLQLPFPIRQKVAGPAPAATPGTETKEIKGGLASQGPRVSRKYPGNNPPGSWTVNPRQAVSRTGHREHAAEKPERIEANKRGTPEKYTHPLLRRMNWSSQLDGKRAKMGETAV